ncbi:unnamed protein product [Ceutorhynchus assimilis]|uniref:MD-2-related lipid-recognition domain-containing protein n=1 Tax=Ceutorhynchus assimilis TaxID=467358 RepID=A0A9N9MUS9_9CUCU|nr:unnamed protein product [Ceutorhynchus assimilis]
MISILVSAITSTLFLSLTDADHVELVSLKECAPLSVPSCNFYVNFNENEQIIRFHVGEVIDLNDFEVHTTVSIKRNGEYQQIISFTKTLCSQMVHILGAEWEKIRAEIQPPIEDSCKIEPGTYKLEALNMQDMDISAILNILPKGEIKLDTEIRWQEDFVVACYVVELIND